MTIYINKDVDERLDYVLTRSVPEDITSVSYTLSSGATINIESCDINSVELVDYEGNVYPENQSIVLWVSGGTPDKNDTVTVLYHTEGGRIYDEKLLFLVEQGC
jgi:hypothetical protein